mgnify:CR=1 FL=1
MFDIFKNIRANNDNRYKINKMESHVNEVFQFEMDSFFDFSTTCNYEFSYYEKIKLDLFKFGMLSFYIQNNSEKIDDDLFFKLGSMNFLTLNYRNIKQELKTLEEYSHFLKKIELGYKHMIRFKTNGYSDRKLLIMFHVIDHEYVNGEWFKYP